MDNKNANIQTYKQKHNRKLFLSFNYPNNTFLFSNYFSNCLKFAKIYVKRLY